MNISTGVIEDLAFEAVTRYRGSLVVFLTTSEGIARYTVERIDAVDDKKVLETTVRHEVKDIKLFVMKSVVNPDDENDVSFHEEEVQLTPEERVQFESYVTKVVIQQVAKTPLNRVSQKN